MGKGLFICGGAFVCKSSSGGVCVRVSAFCLWPVCVWVIVSGLFVRELWFKGCLCVGCFCVSCNLRAVCVWTVFDSLCTIYMLPGGSEE